jgi:NAD(P)-dependent dehydrogenase (short-subunit alcohol dehydrogenase family)
MDRALTQAHDARGGYHLHDSSEERFLLTLLLFVGWHVLLMGEAGRIVSITAQVARGFPGMVHTGAARAGVEVSTAICAATLCPFLTDEPLQNMTMTLSVEWSPYNINVCEAQCCELFVAPLC